MPMMSQTLGAVNPLLSQPDVALPLVGALLVGGGVTLRQILKAADVEPVGDGELEVELLDANAPNGFWSRMLGFVERSLHRGPAEVRAYRGVWGVARPITNVGVSADDLDTDRQTTMVVTPWLNPASKILEPTDAEIANVLSAASKSWVGTN